MCVCIYMYVYVYVYVYVYLYVYLYVYMCMYVYVYMYVCIGMYVCMYVCKKHAQICSQSCISILYSFLVDSQQLQKIRVRALYHIYKGAHGKFDRH
jgi:hypothetical protein